MTVLESRIIASRYLCKYSLSLATSWVATAKQFVLICSRGLDHFFNVAFVTKMEKYENIGMLGEGSYGMVMKCRHKVSVEDVLLSISVTPLSIGNQTSRSN